MTFGICGDSPCKHVACCAAIALAVDSLGTRCKSPSPPPPDETTRRSGAHGARDQCGGWRLLTRPGKVRAPTGPPSAATPAHWCVPRHGGFPDALEGPGKDELMRTPTLFNLDALFVLVIGLVLLFNPLLGPVLPLPGLVVVLAAVALLVLACVLGRAGMGRGALVSRIRALALINLGSSAIVALWAFGSCRAGGRILCS